MASSKRTAARQLVANIRVQLNGHLKDNSPTPDLKELEACMQHLFKKEQELQADIAQLRMKVTCDEIVFREKYLIFMTKQDLEWHTNNHAKEIEILRHTLSEYASKIGKLQDRLAEVIDILRRLQGELLELRK